ncbi:MAG TPA: diaminopimelate epimerase [Edaphocola sp.]|nr:diaminopimelate epimerase [Edaphocola sp.]
MEISFFKYQGAGNDFVMIDNRNGNIQLSTEQIARLCDRRFGIGADGLILLENAIGYDYRMVYFNADGNESTMCGNGGRCLAAFAYHLGVAGINQSFIAIDGPHLAKIVQQNEVALQMKDIESIELYNEDVILDTGSPHYIRFVKEVDAVNVYLEGKAIRNLERFQPKGINVNFVQKTLEGLKIRTYERGVEDETLACGTGVTAAAIANASSDTGKQSVKVQALGGDLLVDFEKIDNQHFQNVWLTGPALLVFKGEITI